MSRRAHAMLGPRMFDARCWPFGAMRPKADMRLPIGWVATSLILTLGMVTRWLVSRIH